MSRETGVPAAQSSGDGRGLAMDAPKVTVLMPVYNAARYLREAMESILSQTFSDFELLIIDDGSTDAGPAIIDSFDDPRIRLIRHEKNLGLIATLNEGLRAAKAGLVARMDADDIAHPDRLEKQVAVLDGNSDIVLVGSDVEIIDEQGRVISYEPKPVGSQAIKIILSVICPIAHPAALFRKEPVLKRGGYGDLYVAEDYDLWTRLSRDGEFANLPLPLLKYRINPEGESLRKTRHQERNSKVVRDREWRKYDDDGPAPPATWSEIWPAREALRSNPRRNELKFYANLHRHFARCYWERGHSKLALQHTLGAMQWQVDLVQDVPSILRIGYLHMFQSRKS